MVEQLREERPVDRVSFKKICQEKYAARARNDQARGR